MSTNNDLKKVTEKTLEAVLDFANALEAASFSLKRQVAEIVGASDQELRATPKEETFSSLLGWTESKGERLGDFEYTSRKANNNSDAYNRAMNILKRSNAAINNPLNPKGWKHRYWFYEDRIFRKQKKK